MKMFTLKSLTQLMLAVLCIAPIWSCSNEEEENMDAQLKAIEARVESKEHTIRGGAYVHVTNSDRENYDSEPIAVKGDVVEIYFDAFHMAGGSKSDNVFYSNKAATIDAIGQQYGMEMEMWSREVLSARLGAGELIKGLDNGLDSCRQGDVLEIYFTSDLGFGSNIVPSIPKYAPLFYSVTVEKVTKN